MVSVQDSINWRPWWTPMIQILLVFKRQRSKIQSFLSGWSIPWAMRFSTTVKKGIMVWRYSQRKKHYLWAKDFLLMRMMPRRDWLSVSISQRRGIRLQWLMAIFRKVIVEIILRNFPQRKSFMKICRPICKHPMMHRIPSLLWGISIYLLLT